MAPRALQDIEAQPQPRRRPFIQRLLTDPPQFGPMKKLMNKMKGSPGSITPEEIKKLSTLLMEVHPEERTEPLQLDVFKALSRVIICAKRKATRINAERERDSIPWTFRDSIMPPVSAKEN